jgi:hypothetical protein
MHLTLPTPARKTAPSVGVGRAENRVWGFFGDGVKRTWKIDPQVVEQHLEKTTTTSRTASCVPHWPSRDPIGERGGINLYAYVDNDGVNGIDYLGLINILASGNKGGFFRRKRESDYLSETGDRIFGKGNYKNVGSRRSRAGVYCTAGLAASRDASKRGKDIGNLMCESSDKEHNILSHSAGVQNAVEGILQFAARFCSPCCGCANKGPITINLMGVAPKRNPEKIRATLEKALKMCPELEGKLKLNIWITYDPEDSKIWKTGGGFLRGAWEPGTLCKDSPFNSCKETPINQDRDAEFGVHGFTSHTGQDRQRGAGGTREAQAAQKARVSGFFNQG